MIIITGKQGQLGNSLILYANFLAFGLEHDIKISNPSFYRYNKYFDFTENKYSSKAFFLAYYYITRLLHKIGSKKVVYLDWHQQIDLDNPSLDLNDKLLQGWGFRGNKILKKHKAELKKLFKPASSYSTKLEEFTQTHLKKNQKITIGLHIRRGDYSWFEGGKYFYSLEQYNRVIHQLKILFPDKDLQILICSNETLTKDHFSFPDIIFGPGHELLDMYSFTYCDYIVGPPSTYTMWASFYGDVPLYMLHDINKPFALTDFKIQEEF